MLVLALHVQGLKGKPKQCHFMCSVVSVKLIVHLSQVHFCTLDSILFVVHADIDSLFSIGLECTNVRYT